MVYKILGIIPKCRMVGLVSYKYRPPFMLRITSEPCVSLLRVDVFSLKLRPMVKYILCVK